MTPSSFDGPKVLEAVGRVLTSRLEEYESACRSSSGTSSSPPPVEPLAGELADLFEELALQELETIRRLYFTPEGSPHPNRTVDYTPMPGVETPNVQDDRTIDHSNSPMENSSTDDSAATGDYRQSTMEQAADQTVESPGPALPHIPGYQIQKVLGRGGMGIVYKARHIKLNRDIALKMILKGEHAGATAIARFLTEARVIAQLNHPNIVQVYEIGEHENLPYFSLEFCPGGSLDKVLRKEPQAPLMAAELTETLARGLAVAHRAGVLHRDIKPANVLLDAHSVPKITDFGLARLMDDESGLTASTSVLGSPSYMSPEQASGTMDRVGFAADQYSLGATLYEFITGRPPFQGTTQIETLKQVRENEPVPPSRLQPTCPRDLETICLKALSKEVDKRYPSIEAFADDLKAYREGRPITARPVGPIERTWRWARRNPKIAILSSSLAVLAATLFVGASIAAIVVNDKNRQISKAFDDLNLEKKQSDENYAFARENGTVILNEVPRLMQKQVLSRGVEADFAKVVERIVAGTGGVRALPDRMLLIARLTKGNSQLMAGDDKGAEAEYTAALELAKSLSENEKVERDKALGHVAVCTEALAQLEKNRYFIAMRQKLPAESIFESAKTRFKDAVRLQRERLESPRSNELPDVERRQTLASSLYQEALLFAPDPDLGGRAVPTTVDKLEKALVMFEEAETLQASVVTAEPSEGTCFRAWPLLGDIQYQLYRVRKILRKSDEAKRSLEQSIASAERAVKDEPSPAAQLKLARRYRLLGDWHVFNGERSAAMPFDQKAYEQMRAVVVVPEVQSVLNELSSDHYRLGADHLKLNAGISASHFRASLRLRESLQTYGDNSDSMKIKVMVSAARCGQTRRAAAMADAYLANNKSAERNPQLQRSLALVYGVCATAAGTGDEESLAQNEIEKMKSTYSKKAIALLTRWLELLRSTNSPGLAFESFRETLRSDPDLDGLRDHPDFQKFLRDVSMTN